MFSFMNNINELTLWFTNKYELQNEQIFIKCSILNMTYAFYQSYRFKSSTNRNIFLKTASTPTELIMKRFVILIITILPFHASEFSFFVRKHGNTRSMVKSLYFTKKKIKKILRTRLKEF